MVIINKIQKSIWFDKYSNNTTTDSFRAGPFTISFTGVRILFVPNEFLFLMGQLFWISNSGNKTAFPSVIHRINDFSQRLVQQRGLSMSIKHSVKKKNSHRFWLHITSKTSNLKIKTSILSYVPHKLYCSVILITNKHDQRDIAL